MLGYDRNGMSSSTWGLGSLNTGLEILHFSFVQEETKGQEVGREDEDMVMTRDRRSFRSLDRKFCP